MAQVETKYRATSSEAARQKVLEQCKAEGVESMLLWFNDLEGHLKSFAITPDEYAGALNDGMGFDTFNVGPELEYFLFKANDGTETLDEGGYFAMTTMDAATELRNDTIRALESMGIPIEYSHHEVGPSQHEIDMRFAGALDMADYVLTYRLIVKEVAAKNGAYATFMPKPIFGENGSGMHTHQSLFTDGRNAFFDSEDKWHLSDAGKAFIAGQLRHAREIAAVFAQWVNSYKRLVPGYEAPVYVAWSQRNRSALIRIPLYKPGSEQATRAEIRCPDPACNPYLTFAALLP